MPPPEATPELPVPATPACPPEMLAVPGGRYALGDADEKHRPPVHGSWVPLGDFEIESFCVAKYPFPGVEGATWPADGLNHSAALRLEQKLQVFGRRLCTASELLLATAGPANARFFYGPELEPGRCETDEESPAPIGSHPRCANALGLRDHLVRSVWVRLDAQIERQLAPEGGPTRPPHLGLARPAGIELAVVGGTPRQDTFYAPNTFGIHAHAADSPTRFLDDGVRVCASMGAARGDWEAAVAEFRESSRFGQWLGIDP